MGSEGAKIPVRRLHERGNAEAAAIHTHAMPRRMVCAPPLPIPAPSQGSYAMSDFDFTSFLKLMVHKKASDLFITAGVAPSMKVQGRIVPITQSPLSQQQSRDMVLNVMTPSQREEFEKTHECQFAISAQGVGRFRVSCFYQRNCVGMVLRRIESKIPTIEELSLPPIIKQLAMTKRGIIIFVGAHRHR